jgi:hypothetical protein
LSTIIKEYADRTRIMVALTQGHTTAPAIVEALGDEKSTLNSFRRGGHALRKGKNPEGEWVWMTTGTYPLATAALTATADKQGGAS